MPQTYLIHNVTRCVYGAGRKLLVARFQEWTWHVVPCSTGLSGRSESWSDSVVAADSLGRAAGPGGMIMIIR